MAFTSASCRKKAPENALVVGTNAEYPPFEYKDEKSSEIVGFDIDLARRIAEKLGKTLVIKDMKFDDLISAVTSGHIDIIAAAFSMTEERGQKIDFTFPYYQATQVILVRKDAPPIEFAKDLKDKKVGAEKGTTSEETAVEHAGDENVVRYDDSNILVKDLREGKIQAVMADEGFADAAVLKYGDIDKVDLSFDDEFYAIGLKKGNTVLLNAINDVFRDLKQSGELTALLEKYKTN